MNSPTHDLDAFNEPKSGNPVMRLVALMLKQVLETGATEMRTAPSDEQMAGIELLIAGAWKPVFGVPILVYPHVVNRLKVMASLSTEKKARQEGEMTIKAAGREAKLTTTVTLEGGVENAHLHLVPA